MCYVKNKRTYFTFLLIFFFLFLISVSSFSQTEKNEKGISALFILNGSIKLNDESASAVNIELKKDNKLVSSVITKKNGKYKFEIEISTVNPKNEYLLYITKEGTVPKSLIINTYLSKKAFMQRPFVRCDFTLSITLNPVSVTDIVINRPSGKIMWDTQKREFVFDQTFLNTMQKEKEDQDKQLRELAEKKKKEEEEAKRLANLKAKEEAERLASQKAKEEAERLADLKAKEEAERILRQNLEAMKEAIRKQREADSLAALNKKENKPKEDFQKFIKPVVAADVDPNAFDGTNIFSINNAKKSLKALQKKMNRKKAANLSTKYETNNILTSLLNMVDENDKKQKSEIKNQK
ncbi:MAG: hypothetical protein V1781_05830 [Bacteroidota bacterium]